MRYLSELVSKKVLNLYSGKVEGTVKDICFNDGYKKIEYLKIFDNDEEEYIINTNKIYKFGQDSIVIKNAEAMTLSLNLKEKNNNIINYDIFSTSGDFLGKVKDIEFNDKFQTQAIISNETKFSPSQIINVGENVIINDNDKVRIRLSNFKPRQPMQNLIREEEKVEILAPTISIQSFNENSFKINASPSPQKVIGNSNFLLGRKALKNIYSINNNLIVKKENIITQKILELAKRYGKLSELTIYSKR